MANIFNAQEVLDMGIEKEKKRRDFYDLVSKKFSDRAMKELFEKLRDWEDAHIYKFTEIRGALEDSETQESYKGESEAYMNALIDDMLYRQVSPKEFSRNINTEIMAIRYGISFEKDAILFFNELLDYMTPSHKDKVLELIGEEKKHILYLTEMMRRYE